MSTVGVNLAVTRDGESYNKLQRPDSYLIPTQPPSISPSTASPTAYGSKRKCAQEEVPDVKRARIERITAHPKKRPRAVDSYQEYGTRTVLPGLDGEEQSSDESTSEALAYLHGVRSEASAIPTLLIAPNNVNAGNLDSDYDESNYKSPMDTQRVIYREGTWIAVDREHNATKWETDSFALDPQEACTNVLLQRFRNLRKKLADIRRYGRLPDTAANRANAEKSGKQEWSETIEKDLPILHEIVYMDESTLYMALQGCTLALGRSAKISQEKSCWIWTLLALVGDFGTLDHERVSRIRDLGLSAGRLVGRLYADNATLTSDAQEDEDTSPKVPDTNSGEQTPGTHDAGHLTQKDTQTLHGVPDEKDNVLDSTSIGNDDVALGQNTVIEETDDSDAEMIMSEDEVKSESIPEDVGLEEARARLLSQLGDRLVHSQVPLPHTPPTQVHHHLSRVEAERQRQEIRRGELQQTASAIKLAPISEPMQAKPQSITPLSESDWNTKVAIDMILTVVAECYGQRDLLKFRLAW
ncbi:hypothetical protein J4E91_000539 [Alternaria rosae]|nr:hypothetical protein J4E91_000539 [Alternaria rosae]